MSGGVLEAELEASGPGVSDDERARVDTDLVSRRRFVSVAVAGTLVAAVPFLWILADEWTGSFNLLRSNAGPNAFYDLQAKAIMHGHLWVPKGSLGIEGFLHNGKTYTYFGLLLSLFRIPIIAVAPRLAGHLAAPSMLVAWILTALLTSMLLWRIRILVRGVAKLGWAEACSYGVLVTTVLAGSVLLFLAAAPRVSDEDIAWTVPITVGTLFVFIGILDRPSIWRVLAAGALLMAGALERPPPGLACIVGALMISGWFLAGRGGDTNRRWALPVAVAAMVPLGIWCLVNWLKFGTIVNGLPLIDQVWTHVNAHRRLFLAATGGQGYSFHFLPTTIWAYLQPFGLRVQQTLPFLTLPVGTPHVFGGYVVDTLNPTASVPATMPLLFGLSVWGAIVSFRRGAARGLALMRIPLIAAAGATVVDLVLGYIAPRYLGDFLPFLIVGSAIGMVELWGRWDGGTLALKRGVVAVLVVVGLFGIAANIGIALSPTTEWTARQTSNYLHAIQAVSNISGHPLARQIRQGSALPSGAPANEVFIVGQCDGLYLSMGQHLATSPASVAEHRTWLPVEQRSTIETHLIVTFNSIDQLGLGVPLVTFGPDTVAVRSAGAGVKFLLVDQNLPITGKRFVPKLGRAYSVRIETNPILRRVVVHINGVKVLKGPLSHVGKDNTPVVVPIQPSAATGAPPLTVVPRRTPPTSMALCRHLLASLKGT